MATKPLPKSQADHLLRIAAAHINLNEAGDPVLPAGWMNSRSEQALEKKGLIRHWEERRPLGGRGAIGMVSMIWKFADLTDEGWAVAKELTA